MRILGRSSSINVRKVLWTLDELEVLYQREDWGQPIRDPATIEFRALNPNAQVPVLVEEDGWVLWESHAIIRHLCVAHDHEHRLMPPDTRTQAIMDQWLTWQATELNPAWSYAFASLVRRMPNHNDRALQAGSVDRWTHKMKLFDERLAETGAYVAGSKFTLADISLGLSVHRWFCTPIKHEHLPMVEAYYARVRERPAALPWFDRAVP